VQPRTTLELQETPLKRLKTPFYNSLIFRVIKLVAKVNLFIGYARSFNFCPAAHDLQEILAVKIGNSFGNR
jgi:hypothetical protein